MKTEGGVKDREGEAAKRRRAAIGNDCPWRSLLLQPELLGGLPAVARRPAQRPASTKAILSQLRVKGGSVERVRWWDQDITARREEHLLLTIICYLLSSPSTELFHEPLPQIESNQ